MVRVLYTDFLEYQNCIFVYDPGRFENIQEAVFSKRVANDIREG